MFPIVDCQTARYELMVMATCLRYCTFSTPCQQRFRTVLLGRRDRSLPYICSGRRRPRCPGPGRGLSAASLCMRTTTIQSLSQAGGRNCYLAQPPSVSMKPSRVENGPMLGGVHLFRLAEFIGPRTLL